MGNINMRQKPVQSRDVAFQTMQPDTVLLNLETGYYYSINSLGAEIWQQCDGETEIAAIIDNLRQKYDVSLDQLKEDAVDFINQMLKEGLLKDDYYD